MAEQQPIEIRFSGGMNNLNSALDLYMRKQHEVPLLVNADLTYPGRIKLLRPLLKVSAAAVTDLHSLCVADGTVFLADGMTLGYLLGMVATSLGALTSAEKLTWAQVGDWLFIGNGKDKLTIYIPTPVLCQWGLDIPTVAPTVTDSGVAGNPDGTYECFYRYRVTLPDGTVVLTALSPVGSVTVVTNKITWALPAYPAFVGATSVQIDLSRTSTALTGTYLVTTLSSPTVSYTDDVSDADLQLETAYAETDYYPPPDNPEIVYYDPGTDRIFATIGGDAYWSEAGIYHIFLYDATTAEYRNVNSVFLGKEHITAVHRFDENLYFGSKKTWRRRRGKAQADWTWEDTSATIGPLNQDGCCVTPWGILHPATDGRLWLFTGNSSKPILEEFVFATRPDASCHATFDGRFYRLFYGDPTYPSLVVDFMKYPSIPPRIVQSTQSATASFFDQNTASFYLSDGHYVRSGEDFATDVSLIVRLPDFPLADLIKFGSTAKLTACLKTDGDDLTIKHFFDDANVSPDTPQIVNNTALRHEELPVPFGEGRTMSMEISITSNADIILQEPWILTGE